MKKKYYVGNYIKDTALFANVYLIDEIKDNLRQYYVMIDFDKNYTWSELNKKNIPLNFYIRERGKWWFKLSNKEQLLPEIKRLEILGFNIIDFKKNTEVQKFIATLI